MIVNGELVEGNQAVVSAYDHGLMYGMGLFETFRTYNRNPFLLSRHLDRLEQACGLLEIHWERDDAQVRENVRTLLDYHRWDDAYFRYTITAGIGELGLPTAAYTQPTQLLYAKPLPALSEQWYRAGKSLQKLLTPRNIPELPIRLKSLHFMNNIIGKQELRKYPWSGDAEGLFLTSEGWLAEGIVSNLFFAKDGTVFTPDLDTGILPGITRAFVLELCETAHVPWQTGHYTWQHLLDADEVFLTNSIQEIVPVTSLYDTEGNHYQVGEDGAGEVTLLLHHAYRQQIGG